jgi:O-antigen/teichoic acid export membrane protein
MDHWRFGRWFCAIAVASWFPVNVYYTLLPALLGFEAPATLRAYANLSMPMLHVLAALSTLILPVLVREREVRGHEAMAETVRLVLGVFLLLSVIYFLCLLWFGPSLLRYLYDGRYDEHPLAMVLVALLPIGVSCTAALGCALRALERPDLILRCHIASSCLAAIVCFPLSVAIGADGALIGILLAYVTAGTLMLYFCRKEMRPNRRDEDKELRRAGSL